MTRGLLLATMTLAIALGAIGVVTSRLIAQERAGLAAGLAAEQRRTVEETRRALAEDLDQIATDLRFVDRLTASRAPSERTAELASLLTWTKPYQRVGIYDAAGQPILEVRDPTLPPEGHGDLLRRRMQEVAKEVVGGTPGELGAAPALAVDDGWYRVFAMPLESEGGRPVGAVAMLVDTQPLFAKLRMITAGESRLLLIGAHGMPVPVSDPALMRALGKMDHAATPAFTDLVARMRAGARGDITIDARQAAALGLGDAPAVASFEPVPLNRRGHWSVALLSSTGVLAAHERAIVARLAASAAAVAVLLIAFFGYAILSSRRAATLRERLAASTEMALMHARTEKILQQIPTGVLALSKGERVLTINRALAERLPPGAVGAPLGEAFSLAPPAVQRMLVTLVRQALTDGNAISLLGESVALFGEAGRYNLHAVPLEHPTRDEHALLVIEDMTKVHLLESQLLRAEKLATVGELAAGVAHEMGTPLGVVRGRAEYLLGKLGREHPQASGLVEIVDQIDQVTRTIRQLLDFSRVSPPQVQAVDLAALAQDTVELLRFETQRRRVHLTVEMPAELPPLSADPDQLAQALVNLVRNAIDACHEGGHVVLRAGADPSRTPWERVRVEVVDDGCGIAPRDVHRVFDPFYTTKKRGQGTGLGLAVTSQVVRNHGGEIALDSDEGRGTTVTLLWPAATRTAEVRHAVG